jgi:6-phosphogluconolactonase
MTQKNINIIKHKNKPTLFTETAKRCQQALQSSLTSHGKASFIIPGGTTPGPAFEQLSKSDLDWGNITIAQSDERWVSSSHPQSNQRLTEQTLLINQAKRARYIAMKNNHATAFAGQAQCDSDYRNMPSPFSLTMLGMGLDGHIASLFPKKEIIDSALTTNSHKLCMAVDAAGCEVAGDYPERMSLTFSGILNSQLILLLMIGKAKLDVVNLALNNIDPLKFPISALLNQQQTPIEIHWCE